jgi:hypothetical protein
LPPMPRHVPEKGAAAENTSRRRSFPDDLFD